MNQTSGLQEIAGYQCKTYGTQSRSSKRIVVLHGYGASAADLFDLGRVLDQGKEYRWFFPQGPLEIPIGPMMSGYAWFPIDPEEAEKAMRENGGLKYSHTRPHGLDESSQQFLSFLQEIGFDPVADSLAGFSQGSMMVVEVQRLLKQPLRKIMLWSSSLVDKAGLQGEIQTFKGTRVFQSHGIYDNILPVQGATALRDELEKLGAVVDYHDFPGGHEIPMPVLASCQDFLRA